MVRPIRLRSLPFATFSLLLVLALTLGARARPFPPAAPQAQGSVSAVQKSATLADFSWLAGRWEGKLGALTAEQEWMAPKNGTLLGFFRLTSSEKTLIIELFTMRETPDGIVFYFRHFSPELVPQEKEEAYRLNLTKFDGTTFRFDNPVVNQLKDAIITHGSDDSYVSHGDITDSNGKPASIEVTYHRVK